MFLDRRLTRDDGRGLGQGVLDNRQTINNFELLFEARPKGIPRENFLTGYPTLLAHHLSIELLYPMHLFHHLTSQPVISQLNLFVENSIFPSDYHLVNLRILNDQYEDRILIPSNRLALIVRRFAYDCDQSYDRFFHFEQVFISLFSKTNSSWFFFSLTCSQHSNISFVVLKFNQSNKHLSPSDISNEIFHRHLNSLFLSRNL